MTYGVPSSVTPYNAATIAALETQTASLLAEFQAYGAERIEPAIVQPAGAFLDRMGEELRARIYVFAGPDGTELCLRPDLTIPAAQTYLARVPNGDRPLKLCYAGPIFRHDPALPQSSGQSFQAGVENFNAADSAAADIETLLLTHKSLVRTGLKHSEVTLGDVGLFASLLDALALPPYWRVKLRRHVWNPARLAELLAHLTSPAGTGNEFLARIGSLAPVDARAALEAALAQDGIKPIGFRTLDEITGRLLERAAEASTSRLPQSTAALITSFAAVSVPATQAIDTLHRLTQAAGISIDRAIDALKKRFELLSKSGFDPAKAIFASRFGRNMEYYTGFVFEFRPAPATPPIAGGGRYDNLLTALGAAKPTPAIGLAIFGDRLAVARGVAS